MNPKLSIVVIVRNQSECLKKNLDWFVFRRDSDVCKRIEIIVVDDASDTEEQFATMQHVSDFHTRTGLGVYEYMPVRRLTGGARNQGLRMSRGEYVWIADGDDRVEWISLPEIVSFLDSHSRVPVVMLDYNSIDPEGVCEQVRFDGSKLKPWQCGVMAWHKVIRRDIYEPFREGVYSEDIDWWMRQCLEREVDHYAAPGIIGYTYRRLSPGSITATGADRTDGRNQRVLNEIKTTTANAIALDRPESFVSHLNWLYKQYDEGKV